MCWLLKWCVTLPLICILYFKRSMAVYLKLDFESHPLNQTVLSLCSVCVCWLQRAHSYISNVDCTQNMPFLRTRAHSASYCWWWSEPFTSIPLTLSSLLLLHKSLHFHRFSVAWDRGRAMTEVSAQVTVILSCCSFPTGSGVDAFLPFLSPHQSYVAVLRIYIPAHQELSLSSLTRSCYTGL